MRIRACGIAALTVVALAGTYVAFAGPLDPPAGPVSPTGRTLDEIYNAVTRSSECSCRWQVVLIPSGSEGVVIAPSGSRGVLHAIMLEPTACGNVIVSNADGSVRMSELTNRSDHTLTVAFDSEFTDGLHVLRPGCGVATAVYRIDP